MLRTSEAKGGWLWFRPFTNVGQEQKFATKKATEWSGAPKSYNVLALNDDGKIDEYREKLEEHLSEHI